MQFKEDFLHFLWKFRLYQAALLQDALVGKVEVLKPGWLNPHAGPDFSEAKIMMDGTLWVGQIEIHLKSSDWLVHGHQHDAAYQNVILHVVYLHDQDIYRADGSRLPVVALQGLFDLELLQRYQQLQSASHDFPCQQHLAAVDPPVVSHFLSAQLVQRLQDKAEVVLMLLEKNHGDWEQTFYHFLCKAFGFKVNALPFELLATSLPIQLIRKYRDQPLQVEALLFGQAGFLEQSFDEAYPQKLRQEYLFLQKKHQLKPIDVSLWKFLRMRPRNFPTFRLAQLAALLLRWHSLFYRQLDIDPLQRYAELYQQLPIHPFWSHHYHFNKAVAKGSVQLGKSSIESLLINTNSLFLYVYGKYTDQDIYIDKAFDLLASLPAEKSRVVTQYRAAGLIMENAYQSQAVLQLNKSYCCQKKCLNCSIGIKILKK